MTKTFESWSNRVARKWLKPMCWTLALAVGAGCDSASDEAAGPQQPLAGQSQSVRVGARRQAEGWVATGTTGVFNEGGGEGQSVAGFQVNETIHYTAVEFGGADRIDFNLGAPYGGGRAELWADAISSGRLLGTLDMGAATGDWNAFAVRSVNIPEIGGTHDLYLRGVATGGDWLYKLDWFELHDTNVAGGVVLPARIEAERFVAASDTTTGNSGSAACTSTVNANVDLEACTDSSGCGCNIGWTVAGEYLDYSVTNAGSATSSFDIQLRVASERTGQRVRVELPPGTVRGYASPDGSTPGWQSWVTRTVAGVPVAPGTQTLRLVFEGELNLNYLDLQPAGTTGNGVAVQVTNKCPFPLWIHGEGNGGILQPDDARLATNEVRTYTAPSLWTSARVTAYLDGPRTNEIDKVEMTFDRTPQNEQALNYNLTYVDWVGLPMEVSSVGTGADCKPAGCYRSAATITNGCPDGLFDGKRCISARTYCLNPVNASKPYCATLDAKIAECVNRYADCRGAAGAKTPEVYACSGAFFSQSPKYCAAINRGMLDSPDNTNKALYYQTPPYNTYAKWAHGQCPNIYALAYDDYPPAAEASGYHSCVNGSRLNIVFCPAG